MLSATPIDREAQFLATESEVGGGAGCGRPMWGRMLKLSELDSPMSRRTEV
jgi:hypothetical protein